jgi:hypothetical protein
VLIRTGIETGPANPARANLYEPIGIKPALAPRSVFAFPVDLRTTLQIENENPARDGLKQSVPPANLAVVQEQVRLGISADQNKRTLEQAGSGGGCGSAGFFTRQSKRAIQPAGFAK